MTSRYVLELIGSQVVLRQLEMEGKGRMGRVTRIESSLGREKIGFLVFVSRLEKCFPAASYLAPQFFSDV